MSFIDDSKSLRTKLHLRDMPAPLRAGLIVLGAIILFVLFQGLWQLGAGESHLIEGSTPSSWQESAEGAELELEEGSEGEGEEGAQAGSGASAKLSVHIVGAIKNPGLYEVDEGSRIKEVVDAAGGLTSDAEEGSINLARVVADGEQIVVASKNASGSPAASAGTSTQSAAATASALVNINTADVTGLSSLSGIGEATAKKIIADREKNGPFKTKKDITRVSGIGDKKYEAIKDSITV